MRPPILAPLAMTTLVASCARPPRKAAVNVRCLLLLRKFYFKSLHPPLSLSLRPSSSFSQGSHALLLLRTNYSIFTLLAATQGLAEAK